MSCHNNYLHDGVKLKAVNKRVQNINIINILLPGGMFDVRLSIISFCDFTVLLHFNSFLTRVIYLIFFSCFR